MEREQSDNVFEINELIRLKRLQAANEQAFGIYEQFVFDTINKIYRMESVPCCITPTGVEIFHIGKPHMVDGKNHVAEHCAASTDSAEIQQACIDNNFVADSPATHDMPEFFIAEFPSDDELRIIVKIAHEQHDRAIPPMIHSTMRAMAIKQDRYFLMPTRPELLKMSGLLNDADDVGDA